MMAVVNYAKDEGDDDDENEESVGSMRITVWLLRRKRKHWPLKP